MNFFDSLNNRTLDEDSFFPDSHEVLVRPSDRKALLGRINKSTALYSIFFDFIYNKKEDLAFLDDEIYFIIEHDANIVGEINGTTGSGKSQLSRQIAKRIARKRKANIRFIIDGEEYMKSKGKRGSILLVLNKHFKWTMDCYITYSFYETTKMVPVLSKKHMIIQDEIAGAMGEDSMLIKRMIMNILDINARKNNISVIFNTPMFVPIKNLNFIVETFGIKNNAEEILTKDNMITYAMLYDKNCEPFSISHFSVWEPEKEHEFYERMSQIRKDEIKEKGGGQRISPSMDRVSKFVPILKKYAMEKKKFRKDELKSLARYIPEFSGIPSAELNDVVVFAAGELSTEMKQKKNAGKSIEEIKKEKERAQHDLPIDDLDEWDQTDVNDDTGDDNDVFDGQINNSKLARTVEGSNFMGVKPIPDGVPPLLNYVSNCIRDDFGEYHQKLWDYIVGTGMTYDVVKERLEKDGVSKSHVTVGSDFNKIRVGSKINGKAIGMGYYVEWWWALSNNTKDYQYFPPANDDKPDYIHVDGTVDSVKSAWDARTTYFIPSRDCNPEIDYCMKHGLKAFRLVFINFKRTTEKFLVRVIDMKDIDKRVQYKPSAFK